METEITQKIDSVLKPAQKIALVLPERIGVDALVSALALSRKLQLDGKSTHIFSSAKNLPKLAFFSEHQKVYQDFSSTYEFTIRVKGSSVKPKQLRYEKEGDDLLIFLTPESGHINENDIELLPQATSFDLLIIIGAASLEKLGALHSKHSELFFNTPKIVINNQLEQEYFGSINWVESSASCLSEQVAEWLTSDDRLLKEDFISTGLLAGIIDATQSFRDPKTTPQTLAIAARLVNAGARRQDIIQHLFKTKSFNLLQLWGRALARIKTIPEQKMLYTLITEQDFVKTESTIDLMPQMLQELVTMASTYQLIAVAAKSKEGVQVYLAGRPHIKLRRLAKDFDENIEAVLEPLNSHFYFVQINLANQNLEQAEEMISKLKLTGI